MRPNERSLDLGSDRGKGSASLEVAELSTVRPHRMTHTMKPMKRMVLAVLTALFVALPALAADEGIGLIDFKNAGVDQVLRLYQSTSGLELFVDSHVNKLGCTVNLRSSAPLTKTEALKRIEQALLDQARVVITRLDDKRASVTCNDALPIAPPSR